MVWSFAGFLSPFYFIVAVVAAIQLQDHPRPDMGALVYFVIIPFFLFGWTAEPLGMIALDYNEHKKLNRLFDEGHLTIGSTFLTGALIGICSHLLSLGIGLLLYWFLGMSLWLLVAAVPSWLGSFLAQSWVVTLADELQKNSATAATAK
jgi:hypothetical protein